MKKSICFAAVTAGTMLAGTGIAAGQEAPPAPSRSPVSPHTVAVGESLSKISLAELGTTDRWGDIFALIRDTLASPELIRVGQGLDIPAPAPAGAGPAVARPAAPPHTVTAGESLSQIAQSELGTSERWVEIFAVNRSTIASPDVLHVGQVLDIPPAPVDVPADLLASLATAPAPAPVPSAPRHAATVGTQATVPSGGGGGNLAAIRACESSGNYGAVSADGLYRGAYQFDRQTWSLFETIRPAPIFFRDSRDIENARAFPLRARAGRFNGEFSSFQFRSRFERLLDQFVQRFRLIGDGGN
jgi:LysM repeat protein